MNIIIRFFYATICFYVCALYMFASFDMIKNVFFFITANACEYVCQYVCVPARQCQNPMQECDTRSWP